MDNKNNKIQFKYVITVIITLIIGVVGTIFTLNYFNLLNGSVIEKTVSNITLSESDTIKSGVDKVYNSVVYVESYEKNNLSGSGSGFAYKTDNNYGYILTNYHVIDGADKVLITNIKGEEVTATVLGGDEYTDIAILKVEKKAVLSTCEFGSSEDANLGDTVFTVGSPLGKTYMGSVTKGIISGKNRTVQVSNQYVMEVLQIDAALNPGNSGGLLANINGEVIGITSMKLVQDEIEGMGFAIPIEMVETVIDDLEAGKSIQRPVLGVNMLDATSTYALYTYGVILNSDITSGVVVISTEDGSPAGTAGLKKGDVILAINEVDVADIAHFRTELYKYNVGDTITLKYYRDNQIKEVSVKLNVSLDSN